MMTIYYTHNYRNQEGESHRLLESAIAAYLSSGRSDRGASADAAIEASRLVSSMRTAGEFGKPYIPGFAPFSISHSSNTWAVLIADAETGHSVEKPGACGLDIQYPRKVDEVAVARRFFADEDAALIEGSSDKERTFFRLWARREALIKAAGGSVAGSDVPPVRYDIAVYEGVVYLLDDIIIPESGAYAAVCISVYGRTAGEITIHKLF